MAKYVVGITDKNDSTIQILVEQPLVGKIKWKTLEHGIWVTNSGGAKLARDKKSLGDRNSLCLSNTPSYSWTGVRLYNFEGYIEVNDSGNGYMVNGWSYNTGYGDNGYTGVKWNVIG